MKSTIKPSAKASERALGLAAKASQTAGRMAETAQAELHRARQKFKAAKKAWKHAKKSAKHAHKAARRAHGKLEALLEKQVAKKRAKARRGKRLSQAKRKTAPAASVLPPAQSSASEAA